MATVFLVNCTPSKLGPNERYAIEKHFGKSCPHFERIKISDWHSHLNFCKKNVVKKEDIIFIPGSMNELAVFGAAWSAVGHGFTHVFFDSRKEQLRKLTGLTVKSAQL